MQLSTTRRAWARWQACAGPWQGWSVCPALLAPEVDEVIPRAVRRPGARPLAASLAGSLGAGGVLLVIDLEPVLGVLVAALLNQWRVANGVLLLPRWPYRQAILPVDGLVHALIGQTRRLANAAEPLPNVAFVLDAERQRPLATRSRSDPRADNRYRLAAGDLPTLSALRAHGIREVRMVSQAPREATAGRISEGRPQAALGRRSEGRPETASGRISEGHRETASGWRSEGRPEVASGLRSEGCLEAGSGRFSEGGPADTAGRIGTG